MFDNRQEECYIVDIRYLAVSNTISLNAVELIVDHKIYVIPHIRPHRNKLARARHIAFASVVLERAQPIHI